MDQDNTATDQARSLVVVTASSTGLDLPRQWTITVDDPRTEKPISDWIYQRNRLQESIDELADASGWRRAPGAAWPIEPTLKPVEVLLERSDIGKRNDQAEKILAEAGLDYHSAHEPYIAAVARELHRGGIACRGFWANPDEPRNGSIELVVPMTGYAETHIAWREDLGWYYMPSSEYGSAHADYTVDLPVGYLDEPHDVAVAVGQALDRRVSTTPPDWQTPADYNADAVAPEAWFDASPDLERALTCYTTYPGWDSGGDQSSADTQS